MDRIGKGHVMGKRQDATARLQAERAAVERIKARATPPEACGDAIPVAPARGVMRAFVPREVVRTDAGNFRAVRTGYAGRLAARECDAFDLMTVQAQRRAGKAAFALPFTEAQVAAGRSYAALVERCEAAGIKCASLEGGHRGDGNGGREEAICDDLARLRRAEARIGDGLAKEVRRVRPSRRGPGARPIRVRDLVRAVCCGRQTLAEVLRAHGWRPTGKSVAALRAALCGALDRLYGHI